MEVMRNTYTTSFPRQVVSRRWASNGTWLSIILASILDQLLWYIHFIITYYCILLQTWGFQLHFVADVDALDVYRLLETWTHSMSTGSCWPSILTVIVKRSFNLRYQTFFGLRTNSSTPGGPLPSLCIRSCIRSCLWKSVVISCFYYVLFRIGSSLLLILNLVIMCNNDSVCVCAFGGGL